METTASVGTALTELGAWLIHGSNPASAIAFFVIALFACSVALASSPGMFALLAVGLFFRHLAREAGR